jgi:hypothetical protein
MYAVSPGKLGYSAHIAGHPGVMHGGYDFYGGVFSQKSLQRVSVHVHGQGVYIAENNPRPAQKKGICGRRKGVGGHNNRIARAYAENQRRKLKRVGAGCGKERLRNTRFFRKQFSGLIIEIRAVKRLRYVLALQRAV